MRLWPSAHYRPSKSKRQQRREDQPCGAILTWRIHDLVADTVYGARRRTQPYPAPAACIFGFHPISNPVPFEPDGCAGKLRDGQGVRQHALQIRGPFHVITCYQRRYPLRQRSPRNFNFGPSREPIEPRERVARRHPAVLRNWLRPDRPCRDLQLPGITPAVFLKTDIFAPDAAQRVRGALPIRGP